MKPAPFRVVRPAALAEALDALASGGEDARPLAGGQSLVPMMNLRLARPEMLVDLSGVGDLRAVERQPDGAVRIGAMTTLRTLERSSSLAEAFPFLREVAGEIAHPPIRNRGTVGGSLSHADPAAELPALALLLGADLELASAAGRRTVPAAGFFTGPYMTGLAEGELLEAVRVPAPPPGRRFAIEKVALRRGDFALAGCLCRVDLDRAGGVAEAAVVVYGATSMPSALPGVDASLRGRVLDTALADEVAGEYAAGVEVIEDLHASAGYRRRLVGATVARALRRAAAAEPDGDGARGGR